IAEARKGRRLANRWADMMQEVAQAEPADLILVVGDMARSEPPMTGAFVAEFARRMHESPAALALPLQWVQQHLAARGQTVDALVQEQLAELAAWQVTVSNSIGSLRQLDTLDWAEAVETLSVVEDALRGDPAGVYPRMDFASRDACRHAVEALSRACTHDEATVARLAVQLAREAAPETTRLDA